MKLKGIRIGSNFKVSADGKVDPDHAAREAKLDLCARIARRSSKKVTVVKRQKAHPPPG